MANRIGDMYVALSLKNQAFKKGWNESEKLMLKKSQAMVTAATRLSVGLTVPLTLIGRASINEFRQFDKAMTRSTAIMENMTAKVRKNMEEQARALSLEGAKSATELAEAYYFLASAGLDADEAMQTLPTTLKFATAGVIELDKAVSLLSRSQNALGMTAGTTAERMANLERVASVLLKANTLADASTQQFAEGLTNKAAAALRLVNKELEEGVAVLAVYAKQGVVGAKAGTFLDMALRELRVKAVKNKDAFKELGINVFDSSGEMKHMADIVGDLETNFSNLSPEMRTVQLMQLGFTQKSAHALQSLIGFSGKIRENETALTNLGGILDKISKEQLASFDAQIVMLGHKFDFIQKEIGQEFVPVVNEMNEAMKTAIVLWSKLDKETKTFIVTAGSATAVIGPLLGFIGGMGILAIHFKTAIGLLATFAAKLAILGASAVAIVAVFDYFFANFKGKKFDQLALDIGTAWELLLLDMSEMILIFLNDMDGAWEEVKLGAIIMSEVIAEEISSVFNNLVDEASSAWQVLRQKISQAPLVAAAVAQKNVVFATERLREQGVIPSMVKGKSGHELFKTLQSVGKSGADLSEAFSRAGDFNKAIENQAKRNSIALIAIEEQRIVHRAKLKNIAHNEEIIKLSTHNNRMKILNKDFELEQSFLGGRKEQITFIEHMANRLDLFKEKMGEFGEFNKEEWSKIVAQSKEDMDEVTKHHDLTSSEMEERTRQMTSAQKEYYDTLHEGMKDGFTSAWETMFTKMMEGTATLQDAFQQLGMELLKVVAQQSLIKPLASSFGVGGAGGVANIFETGFGIFNSLSASAMPGDPGLSNTLNSPIFNANGNAFGPGGVLNSPTPFSMGGGRTGIAGEAGPEAALPLSRMSDGKLGVAMTGGGGNTTINHWNITTPDADSFRRSKRQITKRVRS